MVVALNEEAAKDTGAGMVFSETERYCRLVNRKQHEMSDYSNV
jgi:hypothetical protein